MFADGRRKPKCYIATLLYAGNSTMNDDQIIDLWLSSQRSERTREAYAGDILLLRDHLKKRIPEIELRDLQQFQERLNTIKTKHGKPYAEKTKQRILTAVKSLFSFAAEEGLIGANPARRIQLPKCKDDRGARVLPRSDVDKLIAATKTPRD